ncbi:MAG: type II CAAX endopeptidase family protein [Anaerolineaceae bacterium]|jgi:membrane protease YdiL (CAAX protease family)|nr:type II CAAX endopeptidase family protein [Anaerolineaceae bacterium]
MIAALKERLSRLWKNHPRLSLLLAVLPLLVILSALLFSLNQSPQLTMEWRLLLMLTAALLSLWIGLGGISLILKRQGRSLDHNVYIVITLVLAYLIPAVIFVLPDWLIPFAVETPPAARLAAGQPWFYLWQALALAGSGFIRISGRLTLSPAKQLAFHWQLTLSLLTGLTAWLFAAFLYALLSTPFPVEPDPPSDILQAALFIVSVLIAPWAEERFFRGEILPAWEDSHGRTPAILFSAALFATLQLRPLLWLPAFVIGLALGELALRTRRLIYPILAHALINLLFFLLGWYLVI